MQQYAWPGNVREIAMVARQARVQLASRERVCVEVGQAYGDGLCFSGPDSIPTPIAHGMTRPGGSGFAGGRSNIMLALAETDGNRAEAARRLGVSRSTLYRRMEKLGILGKMVSN